MPPPKKKNPPNAYMMYVFEWKHKHGRHMSMKEAYAEAGHSWSLMTANQRAPYAEMAKEQKHRGTSEKLTCTGVPISAVENERTEAERKERQMKRTIENCVRHSVKKSGLETQIYYFLMVNYFTKTLKGGVYVPAEISVCEYSLKSGVNKIYHTYINPGVTIYGHQYEAQHLSETTHKLPLPPNAKGEKNLGRIYNDVIRFIRNANSDEIPPVYTNKDSIPIVESVLEFLKADVGAEGVKLQVYSIQYLFYLMKEATCEMGDLEKPKSFYITDAYFERDFFEYQTGIACDYHEKVDATKYCTQSCVVRWGFMFSDYMCRDIAISLIPGRHIPEATNLRAIITPAPGERSSHASMYSDNTQDIKPFASSDDYSKKFSKSRYSKDSDGEDRRYSSRKYSSLKYASDKDRYSKLYSSSRHPHSLDDEATTYSAKKHSRHRKSSSSSDDDVDVSPKKHTRSRRKDSSDDDASPSYSNRYRRNSSEEESNYYTASKYNATSLMSKKSTSRYYDAEEYPSTSRYKHVSSKPSNSSRLEPDRPASPVDDDLNPWAARSRNIPRPPLAFSDYQPNKSTPSYGRGRAIINHRP